MFNIVLYQPEIPPNTGNIIRVCANTGARLHLIEPLGFALDDAKLKRAGLDYRDLAEVRRYASWENWLDTHPDLPIWAFSTRGAAAYHKVTFNAGDALLFGPETRGLPVEVRQQVGADRVLHLPMLPHSRSLNLSNAVAVGLYEALRQQGFAGLD
jgi:tRNA (cytidine/uridine-2'-O-)-methyltransferase